MSGSVSITAIPNLGTATRPLSALTGDAYNLKNLGALLDGSVGDFSRLQTAYNTVPDDGVVEVPAGIWPTGTLTPNTSKLIMWNFTGNVYNQGSSGTTGSTGSTVGYIGDGDLSVQYSNGWLQYYQQFINTTFSRPSIAFNYLNNRSVTSYGTGNVALQINATSSKTSIGFLNAQQTSIYSNGRNGYSAGDIGHTINMYSQGTNWTWCAVFQNADTTFLPGSASVRRYTIELDHYATGPEVSNSYYNPTAGVRCPVLVQLEAYPLPAWSANTAYAVGATVAGLNGGAYYAYVCTTAGTTGATQPTWPLSGSVTDGTVVWTYSTTAATQIGMALNIQGGSNLSVGSYLTGGAVVYNAVCDFSQVILDHPTGKGAGMRLTPNMPIDFSCVATSASQNLRTLAFNSTVGGLIYVGPYTGGISSGLQWASYDTGQFYVPSLCRASTFVAATTGGSTTAAAGTTRVGLLNSSSIATYTVTMPASPQTNQEFELFSQGGVMTLTLNGNGASFSSTPTSLTSNTAVRFVYDNTYNIWYRTN